MDRRSLPRKPTSKLPVTDRKPAKECELDLSIGCVQLNQACLCYKVNKCIEVCDALAPVTLSCGCGGGKHLESCTLKGPLLRASCQTEVAFCVFPGDAISGNYTVSVKEQGEEFTALASTLTITNKNAQDVTIDTVTAKVLLNALPLLPGGNELQLSPPLVIPAGESRSTQFTASFVFDPSTCTPETTLLLQVTAHVVKGGNFTTTVEIACEDVPACDITQRCLTDENADFEPFPINVPIPNGKVTVDVPFGPIVIEDAACGTPIENTATLQPFPCDVVPPPPLPPGEQGAVVSNTTTIIPSCTEYALTGSAEARCAADQQWCICKTGTSFTSPGCVSDNFPSATFARYNITATLMNEQPTTCTLSFNAAFTIGCALPYDKNFRFDILAGELTDSFEATLLAGETVINIGSSYQLPPGEVPPATVVITPFSYLTEFNLSTCEVVASDTVVALEPLELEVVVVDNVQTVILTDEVTFQPVGMGRPIDVDDLLPTPPCDELLGATLNGVPIGETGFTFDQVFGALFSPAGVNLGDLPSVDSDIVLSYVVNVVPGTTSARNNATLTITRNGVPSDTSSSIVTLNFNPPVPGINPAPVLKVAQPRAKLRAMFGRKGAH